MIGLKYKDIIRIVNPSYDGYGDEGIESDEQVKCLFLQSTGHFQSSGVDYINADAHVYVDPKNEFVSNNKNRLEGMYIYANLFGDSEDESWYRVERTVVGMDKLLTNKIDNVHLYLSKSEKPNGIHLS